MNNYEDVVSFTANYLRTIGVNSDFISENIEEASFGSAWIMKLPSVCILKENRLNRSGSNQTHIHVTGESMHFFFNHEDIESLTQSSDDVRIRINLINNNLVHLETIKRANRDRRLEPMLLVNGESSLVESGTVKKLAYRNTGRHQVQLSKHSLDHPSFSRLRRSLFAEDLLIFFKSDSRNYLVVAVPSTFGETEIINEPTRMFSNVGASTRAEIEYDASEQGVCTRQLRNVRADDIGRFTCEENTLEGVLEDDTQNLYDLSEGILRRRERTIRHHNIVRAMAELLENNDFDLYENPIDCLAVKEDVLMFEVKTLDGTDSDEMKQVRAALGQLLYYETFSLDDYRELPCQKIALFESKISDDHISFLEDNSCLVMWVNDNEEFESNSESAVELLRSLSTL